MTVAVAEEAEAFLEREKVVISTREAINAKIIWSVQMVARASMSAVRGGSITATTRRAKRQGPCAGAWKAAGMVAIRIALTPRATIMLLATA